MTDAKPGTEWYLRQHSCACARHHEPHASHGRTHRRWLASMAGLLYCCLLPLRICVVELRVGEREGGKATSLSSATPTPNLSTMIPMLPSRLYTSPTGLLVSFKRAGLTYSSHALWHYESHTTTSLLIILGALSIIHRHMSFYSAVLGVAVFACLLYWSWFSLHWVHFLKNGHSGVRPELCMLTMDEKYGYRIDVSSLLPIYYIGTL